MAAEHPVAKPESFGPDWITAYFEEVDRMDPEALVRWYHDDATFRFANQPPAEGIDAIRSLLAQFYGSIRSMHHEPEGIWSDASSGVLEASVSFVRPDGQEVVVPAVSVLRVRDGLVSDFRFVMDPAPLQGAANG